MNQVVVKSLVLLELPVEGLLDRCARVEPVELVAGRLSIPSLLVGVVAHSFETNKLAGAERVRWDVMHPIPGASDEVSREFLVRKPKRVRIELLEGIEKLRTR